MRVSPIIEVKGITPTNVGAYLMLLAIRDGMDQYNDGYYALNLRSWRRFEQGARKSYRPLAYFPTGSRKWPLTLLNRVARALPRYAWAPLGLTSCKEVSCVLDASGFSYSDQLSLGNMASTAEYYKWLHRRGVPIVLLPQALGPFQSSRSQELIKEIVSCASLVYCRDDQSYAHIVSVCGHAHKIRIAPDFTFGISSGRDQDSVPKASNSVILIPNMRMVDMTPPGVGTAYTNFLYCALDELYARGIPVHVVVQGEAKDIPLAERLAEHPSVAQLTLRDDPINTKRIVGAGRAIISSRFHGAVNALSCGRPPLVTSWSHKYEELMNAFGLSDLVIDLSADEDEWREAITNLLAVSEDSSTRRRIAHVAAGIVSRSKAMWTEVAEAVAVTDRTG